MVCDAGGTAVRLGKFIKVLKEEKICFTLYLGYANGQELVKKTTFQKGT